MPNIIIKRHLKPTHRLIIAKKPKQKLKQSVNYHQLTKTATSRRRQPDLTIESMQQSIETHGISLLNLFVGNAEYSFCFFIYKLNILTFAIVRGCFICKPRGSNCNWPTNDRLYHQFSKLNYD